MHFDDLDPMGMVHNAWYAPLIERRWPCSGNTWPPFREGRPTTPDAFNVVKEFTITLPRPDPRARRHPRSLLARAHRYVLCGVHLLSSLSDGTTVYAEDAES